MSSDPSGVRSAFASLRQLAGGPLPPLERCELCEAGLPSNHSHLVETANRRLVCACEACALLFDRAGAATYRRVPRGVEVWPGFRLTDEQWEGLRLPIDLAFFLHSTPAGRVVAVYPSPAGATESLLPMDAWQALVEENPVLGELQPDVEALLVNRVGPEREYFRVGIDECYRLVGLLRSQWRGLSGGAVVWEEIGRFFGDLKQRARTRGGPCLT